MILKLGGEINILSSKIFLWVNHLWTRLLLVKTRPTEQRHQLTRFMSGQKIQSLRHEHDQRIHHHYQRIHQGKMEKQTYQRNRIQTHHCQTHYWTNLICRMIAIPVNKFKINAIGRKSVINTRKGTRQTHCQEILIHPTTVNTDASDIKRRAIGKSIR